MIRHRIGVEYSGRSKEEIKQQQLENIKYLEDNNLYESFPIKMFWATND